MNGTHLHHYGFGGVKLTCDHCGAEFESTTRRARFCPARECQAVRKRRKTETSKAWTASHKRRCASAGRTER